VSGWLTLIRDRPSSERERHTATTAVLAGIIAAVLLLAVTRGEPSAPAATHTSPTTTPAVHTERALDLSEHSAAAVARRFLAGYLAYAYGRAPATSVPDAAQALIASLEHHPSRVTVAPQTPLPRVQQLDVTLAQSGQPAVNAVLNDGGIVNYALELVLARADGRLIVSTLEPAQ
jgi:hypothetical protein